jgi:hypothetical protein
LIIFFLGVIYFLKDKINILKKISFLLLPLLPFFILGFLPSYKYLISIIPLIFIILVYGFRIIMKKKIFVYLFVFLIFIFWFVGVQINTNKLMYGPSFEFKNPKNISNSLKKDIGNVQNGSVDFNGGFFMPTPEGGRPLYGFFYVFNKQWYLNVNKHQKVLDDILNILVTNNNIIYIQDRETAFFQTTIVKNKYLTKTDFLENKNFLYRDYIKNNKKIRLNVLKNNCDRSEFIIKFLESNKNVIFRSSYPSLILEILNKSKNSKKIQLLDCYTIHNIQ